jgi:hypothetical protein
VGAALWGLGRLFPGGEEPLTEATAERMEEEP